MKSTFEVALNCCREILKFDLGDVNLLSHNFGCMKGQKSIIFRKGSFKKEFEHIGGSRM